MKSALLLLLLLVAAGPLVAKERRRLSLGPDGGYRDLVVAIDRSWPEDATLLERIKTMLREFSEQLSTATKPMFNNGGSLRLRQVFILVPKTWTNSTEVNATSTWQTYGNADIRLGNSPGVPHYTYHGGNCATIGDHVMFDSNHVRHTDGYWLGKQMLYEFSQYRWGLRREHNGEKGPHHYLEGRNIVPALCVRGIKGSFRHNETQQPCKVDANSLQLEPNCRFYPDLEQDVSASLLSTIVVRNIDHFCDYSNSAPDETRHNKLAPVPLNHFSCGAHSGARDLMRKGESRDFISHPTLSPTPPPVEFTIVRPMPYRRLVIVVDVSESMGGNLINKVKFSMVEFITDMLEDGIECALVTFNEVAKVVKPLGFLNTRAKRDEYANAVRTLTAAGGRAIGEGLALGMTTLGVDTWNPTRHIHGYILILSNGQENSNINFTLPQAANVLRNTSIIVDTVLLGPNADKRLTQLSEDTGGYSFFSRIESSTNDLIEQLSKTVRDRIESTLMPIDIFSAPIEQPFSIPLLIDSSVGKDTSFLLSTYRAADITSMDLRVVSPNGTVYDKNSRNYIKDRTLGTVTIKLAGQAESGQWTVTDGTSAKRQPTWSNADVFNTRSALTVPSTPASQELPVIIDGSVIGETEIRLSRSTEVVIVASLFRGAQLLRGAKILAKIESESNVDAVLEMQDLGVHPDVEADDGIYSAQVPLKSIMKVQEYNVRLISESPVNRVTSAGKIYVKSVDTGSLQNLPPSSVQDLKISVDLATQTVRLSWTAVGNEQSQGTAAKYIIRSSDNATVIQEMFGSADEVSVPVTPLTAGSAQSVNISSGQMSNYNGTFYMAVQALSNNGVASAVSNMVATQLILPDNIDSIDGGATTTLTPEVPTTSRTGSRNAQSCGGTAVLSLGFLGLLAVRAAAAL